MSEPKYSLREIDQMREAVYTIRLYNPFWNQEAWPSGTPDSARTQHALIEDRLRTYMLNGTPAEELVAEAARVRAERDAEAKDKA